jgi:hypothetical protein
VAALAGRYPFGSRDAASQHAGTCPRAQFPGPEKRSAEQMETQGMTLAGLIPDNHPEAGDALAIAGAWTRSGTTALVAPSVAMARHLHQSLSEHESRRLAALAEDMLEYFSGCHAQRAPASIVMGLPEDFRGYAELPLGRRFSSMRKY